MNQHFYNTTIPHLYHITGTTPQMSRTFTTNVRDIYLKCQGHLPQMSKKFTLNVISRACQLLQPHTVLPSKYYNQHYYIIMITYDHMMS